MDNKQKQIKYMQQRYYIKKYRNNKAIIDIVSRINNDVRQNNWQYYPEIAVSNTFTQEWEMEDYFKLDEKYGYKVVSLILENRHGSQNVHGVPDEKLQIMKDRFEIKLLW